MLGLGLRVVYRECRRSVTHGIWRQVCIEEVQAEEACRQLYIQLIRIFQCKEETRTEDAEAVEACFQSGIVFMSRDISISSILCILSFRSRLDVGLAFVLPFFGASYFIRSYSVLHTTARQPFL